MQNPKTSWAGWITLAATILNMVAQVFAGHATDPTVIATTAAGASTAVGLFAAKDGAH